MLNVYFLIIFYFFVSSCSNNNNNKLNNYHQLKTQKYIVYNSFPSEYVSPRDIEVWLPADYDNYKSFPVLYMFDGQNIFHGKQGWNNNQYNHGWQVDETLDSLFMAEKVPPMIVVGIFNTGIKRASEYMPAQPREEIEKRIPEAVSWVREGYQKYGITSDDFLKFLVKELKPFIDKNYKTQEKQSSTYLAGSSMGGLISAYAICEYPNTFGSVACFSTHWTALNGVFIEYLKNNIPNPSNHKFYFDYGTLGLDSQYETYQIKVDSLMIAKGYEKNKSWLTKKFEGHGHNEKFWRSRFHYPFEFFFNSQE